MLKGIGRAYTAILRGMFALSAIYFGLMMVVIVYYTLFRAFSLDYSRYSVIFIELGFIYCLMLGAPWLVRERGHVYIEIVTAAVPAHVRILLSRCIAAFCFIVCGALAIFGGALTVQDYAFNELDTRGSIDIPRWIVIVSLPVGFGLMATEFLRFVFAKEPFHTGEAGVHE
jgi:TRAP-type C4-dicarboxylate transport system permease small subunit